MSFTRVCLCREVNKSAGSYTTGHLMNSTHKSSFQTTCPHGPFIYLTFIETRQCGNGRVNIFSLQLVWCTLSGLELDSPRQEISKTPGHVLCALSIMSIYLFWIPPCKNAGLNVRWLHQCKCSWFACYTPHSVSNMHVHVVKILSLYILVTTKYKQV